MKLLREIIDTKIIKSQIIEEADITGKKGIACYIQGPFIISEERNKNGRIYKKDTILREVNEFVVNKIKKGRAAGELNHPDSPTIDLERISHYITDLQQEDNIWYGKAKLANTPLGQLAQTLVKDGYQLGVSTRGLGDVSDDGEVSDNYKLITVDLVSDPSKDTALVEAIYENKSYFIRDGLIFETPVDEMKKKFSKMPKSNKQEYLTKAITDFIKALK